MNKHAKKSLLIGIIELILFSCCVTYIAFHWSLSFLDIVVNVILAIVGGFLLLIAIDTLGDRAIWDMIEEWFD